MRWIAESQNRNNKDTAAEAATEANGETGWMQSGKTAWRTEAELRFQADEDVTEGPRRCAKGLALGGRSWVVPASSVAQWPSDPVRGVWEAGRMRGGRWQLNSREQAWRHGSLFQTLARMITTLCPLVYLRMLPMQGP